MTRKLTVFAALALAAFAGIYLYGQRTGTPADPLAAYAQDAADVDTSMIQEMSIGNPDAKVTVIEYASFTCPHCAAFHADGFKKLKAEYIDTGKINFIYREVYFQGDRPAFWASVVARCGENPEQRFFGIVDMIFDKQRTWASATDATEMVGQLRTYGKIPGLTDAELDQCLTDNDRAHALYARWIQNGQNDNVQSTPTFIINGVKTSNKPYDELKSIIDAAL